MRLLLLDGLVVRRLYVPASNYLVFSLLCEVSLRSSGTN